MFFFFISENQLMKMKMTMVFLFSLFMPPPLLEGGIYIYPCLSDFYAPSKAIEMVSAYYFKYHLSQSHQISHDMVKTSRWPSLILGSLGQRSRSGRHMCRSTFLVLCRLFTRMFIFTTVGDKCCVVAVKSRPDFISVLSVVIFFFLIIRDQWL